METQYEPTPERRKFIMELAIYCLIEDDTEIDGVNLARSPMLTDEEWNWLITGYTKQKEEMYGNKNNLWKLKK